jgi:outer membrane protein assembly factor BamB
MRLRVRGAWCALMVIGALAAQARSAPDAAEIVRTSGVKGGIVVHIGCRDGKQTAAMRVDERYLVHGLDADAEVVAAAREHIRSLGAYGPVSVDVFDGKRLPYIDNMVNLVVVSDLRSVPMSEVTRVLCPDGVAMVGGTKTVKPRPADMDEWTHWLYGPGNNAVSRDRRVGVSRNLQWSMPPRWSRHHNLLPSVSAMVSAGGRLFTIIDEGPISVKGVGDKWALVARDAFNGVLLWKRPIPKWGWKQWSAVEFSGQMRFKGPDQTFRRLVAVGDVVYATLGFNEPIVALDAATGKTIRTYKGTENVSEVLYRDGLLVLARNAAGAGKNILTLDAETGAVRWEKTGYKGVTARTDELARFTDAYVTVGDDCVYFLDRGHVIALELTTGKEVWRKARPDAPKGVAGHYGYNHVNLCTLVYRDNILYMGQVDPFGDNLNKRQEKAMTILAMDGRTGKSLWQYRGATFAHFVPPDIFVTDGMVWTFKRRKVDLVGLDTRTGAVKKTYPAKDILVGHHARCYRNKATDRFYLAGEEGIEYIDFASGAVDIHHWLRGACKYGILPANGLIYLPTHSCGCHSNVKLNGFFALTSDAMPKADTPLAQRLTRGPAYADAVRSFGKGPAAGDEDWPVYRHDNRRSSGAGADVSGKLSQRWASDLGGHLTAPVIVGERVFVAREDTHEVFCLDTASGKPAWRFTADGAVDTPPSWSKGRIIFGTHGGSVYSLRAADGGLVWRFQAAPQHLRLSGPGGLESPWPVHGSPLIMNDRVYCVAGRSMHLNGGLSLYALDANTGKCLRTVRLEADTKPKGELGGAVLPDLLVSDGKQIHMRSMSFSPADLSKSSGKATGGVLLASDGGLLDGTWFNSTFRKYGKVPGQMLAFDGEMVYGIRAYKKFVAKSYPQDIFTPGKDRYRLFATAGATSKDAVKDKRRGKSKSPALKDQWTTDVTLRAEGMVLTKSCIVLAGPPDVLDAKDPLAAFEGRAGGRIVVYARSSGKKTAEIKLASPPVFDGLAAANGNLYVSTHDGKVVCIRGSK